MRVPRGGKYCESLIYSDDESFKQFLSFRNALRVYYTRHNNRDARLHFLGR
jgi:hypothetical protein